MVFYLCAFSRSQVSAADLQNKPCRGGPSWPSRGRTVKVLPCQLRGRWHFAHGTLAGVPYQWIGGRLRFPPSVGTGLESVHRGARHTVAAAKPKRLLKKVFHVVILSEAKHLVLKRVNNLRDPSLFQQPAKKHQSQVQLRITLADWPVFITSKPLWNSSQGKRWVMTGLMSSPDCSMTVILYQVSYISRP